MRTTIDIDEPILNEVKSVQKREGKSLGQVVSDLLAVGLADRRSGPPPARGRLHWVSKAMGARVDLADREAVYAAMDGGQA
jgi:hypothetical protein